MSGSGNPQASIGGALRIARHLDGSLHLLAELLQVPALLTDPAVQTSYRAALGDAYALAVQLQNELGAIQARLQPTAEDTGERPQTRG